MDGPTDGSAAGQDAGHDVLRLAGGSLVVGDLSELGVGPLGRGENSAAAGATPGGPSQPGGPVARELAGFPAEFLEHLRAQGSPDVKAWLASVAADGGGSAAGGPAAAAAAAQ